MKKITLRLVLLTALSPLFGFGPKGPTPVFIANVERKTFTDEVEALGTLQANENVELTATVTELVTSINFEDGQRVKQGDIIIKMDASEELALKAEERSRLKEARRQVKRLQPLVAKGAASKSSLDERQLVLQTAQARMRAIDAQVHQRRITAPFDGVLGQRNISVGALVQPGTLITTIDDDSKMKLDFQVPEVFQATLKQGLEIEATSNAWPKEIFTGTIFSINSRVDPITRSIAVRAIIPNPDFKLRPGNLMRVNLKKNPRQAIVIPEEAIITRAHELSVFKVQDSQNKKTAKRTIIKIGTRHKGEVEVLSGLNENDQIVTHGTLKLKDGSPVTIKAIEQNNTKLKDLLNQNADKATQETP